jgi:hypothetical protein
MTVLSNKLCVSDLFMLSPYFIAFIPNQISYTYKNSASTVYIMMYLKFAVHGLDPNNKLQ